MKRIIMLLIVVILSFLLFNMNVTAKEVNVYVFHSQTCEHCKSAINYLESIKDKYDLNIYKYEVQEEDTKEKIKAVEEYFDISITSVPMVIINNKHMSGYTKEVTDDMYIYNIKLASDGDFVDEVGIKLGVVEDKILKGKKTSDYKISVFGKSIILNKKNVFLNTIVLGFTKAFNPILILSSILLISILIMLFDKRYYVYILLDMIIDLLIYYLFITGIIKIQNSFKLISLSKLIIFLLLLVLGLYSINKEMRLYESIKLDKVKLHSNVIKIVIIILFSIFMSIIKVYVIGGIPNLLSTISISYKILYGLCYFILSSVLAFIFWYIIKITGLNKYKYSKLIFGILMFILGFTLIMKPSIFGI